MTIQTVEPNEEELVDAEKYLDKIVQVLPDDPTLTVNLIILLFRVTLVQLRDEDALEILSELSKQYIPTEKH